MARANNSKQRTAAQIEEDHLLMAGMEADLTTEEVDGIQKLATLEVAYGQGEDFSVGTQVYSLAPFATKNLKKAYALLNRVPAILTAQALAAKDGERAALDTLTDTYNALLGRSAEDEEKPLLSQEYVANLLANYPQLIGESEEACAPVLELAVLALSRRHPGLSAQDLEDEFDLAFIVRFIRAISRVNTGLSDSF